VTAVQPPGRFGLLDVQGEKVVEFNEKPLGDGSWINGGYFVLSPKVIERINGDATSWESEPLKGLAEDGELTVYKHQGFWQPMDTLRDKNQLEELWDADKAPVENLVINPSFWKDKRVFVTGHTGFKGGWICLWLKHLGAEVIGYSLEPATVPSLFEVANVGEGMQSIIGDIRDDAKLSKAISESNPDLVIHMAAQPLVRYSYAQPAGNL
jgi:hypothetical protein